MNAVHICCPETTAKSVKAMICPDCQHRTRMLGFFQPWYGWHSTCLKCGRQWEDGEWLHLDFVNGHWGRDRTGTLRFMKPREFNIESAKRRWRGLPPVSENHYGMDQ